MNDRTDPAPDPVAPEGLRASHDAGRLVTEAGRDLLAAIVQYDDFYGAVCAVESEAVAWERQQAATERLRANLAAPVAPEGLDAIIRTLDLTPSGDLAAALAAAKARADDLRWCNKDDDCNVMAKGADLAIEDFTAALRSVAADSTADEP